MLFNSLSFLLIFLPIVSAGFLIVRRYGNIQWVFVWLFVCSSVFYGAWEPKYIILLFGSIAGNYCAALLIAKNKSRIILGVAIAGDLATLGYFKYANFFARTFSDLSGLEFHPVAILLPLGISFITFIQIAFLVDVYRDRTDDLGFPKYALFVAYFPHLIAGPIIHHKEVMSQFTNERLTSISSSAVVVGIAFILCGLFKKVVIADTMSGYASLGFHLAARQQPISLFDAWGAALAFTFQIYFDFSGYSDIAIGLSRLFGIKLPYNFDSPYKSLSIIDFWRRWHMTLSRFLRDYLYIPLGGNRNGVLRRHAKLLITMVLGGLWHGAGWTFVVWGALHGAFLIINHGWRAARRVLGIAENAAGIVGRLAAWALTFLAVVVAWVFFRAPDLRTAFDMLSGMAGLHG